MSNTMTSNVGVLEAALAYLAQGWSVIPVNGKQPLVRWQSYQSERASEATVREWWARWPAADIGIVTGAVSGLVVLDLDHFDPEELLAHSGGSLPRTPIVQTARGYHVYFEHPGRAVRNRAGLLPGVDLRGDGGFVLAPPSLHASGHRYTWKVSPTEAPVVPIPEWLHKLLAAPPAHPAPMNGERNGGGP
jgi:hypothetical protein